MSLQAKLDAFRTNFEAGGPPYNAPDWVHEPMHRATREMSGPRNGPQRGTSRDEYAPTFVAGRPLRLSSAVVRAQHAATSHAP